MAKAKVIHSSVEIVPKFNKKDYLTADEAMELLGWEVEDTEAEEKWTEYTLRDALGNKVRLNNRLSNRPFRSTIAKRHSLEMLRGKWRFNGETFVVDRYGDVQNGQHRLTGLVLAEQMRQADPDYWKQYGVSGPIKIPALIIYGIDESPDVVDTIDLAQTRTLADVIFRNHTMDSKQYGEKEQKTLSRMLAVATRLVWLRVGGKTVSDAPHFPHSEALEFIEKHPRLVEAVTFIFEENGGSGVDGKRISTFLSLGYAAGLCYLMGMSETDPEGFHEDGSLDETAWDKAEEFWVGFANQNDNLFKHLTKLLVQNSASGAQDRDEKVGMIVKAWDAFVSGKNATGKDLKIKRTKDAKGRLILAETPRVGGIDTQIEVAEEGPKQPAKEAKASKPRSDKRRGSKSKGGWDVGDTAWIRDPDGEHWFGEIIEIIETEGSPKKEWVANLISADDGQEYEAKFADMSVGKPRK